MTKCYLSYNNITSSLGFDTHTVFNQLKNKKSGIQLVEDSTRFYKPFYGAVIPTETIEAKFKILESKNEFTRLEKMLMLSLSKTINASGIDINTRVGLIISTTKGNIDVLEDQNHFPKERAYLGQLGHIIKDYFNFKNDPLVISNACVSGILSVAIAKRYLQEGIYDHIF